MSHSRCPGWHSLAGETPIPHRRQQCRNRKKLEGEDGADWAQCKLLFRRSNSSKPFSVLRCGTNDRQTKDLHGWPHTYFYWNDSKFPKACGSAAAAAAAAAERERDT